VASVAAGSRGAAAVPVVAPVGAEALGGASVEGEGGEGFVPAVPGGCTDVGRVGPGGVGVDVAVTVGGVTCGALGGMEGEACPQAALAQANPRAFATTARTEDRAARARNNGRRGRLRFGRTRRKGDPITRGPRVPTVPSQRPNACHEEDTLRRLMRTRSITTTIARSILALCAPASAAFAQTIPGNPAAPGETVAGASGADGARLNPAMAAQSASSSLRITHVTEVRRARGAVGVDATAIAYSAGLPLGLGVSIGATWERPTVAGSVAHRVVADGALSLTLQRGLTLGARARIASAVASPLASAGDGPSLDLGALWRPNPWISLGAATNGLLGPRAPELGALRAVTAGAAVRPLGTDAWTVAADGTFTEAGSGSVRAASTVGVGVGRLRAEAAMDLPTGAWRAAAGLELGWGSYALGAGALVGGSLTGLDAPLGAYATAAWESERHRALPEAARLIVLRLDGDLSPEALVRTLLRLERLRRDPTVAGVVFAPRADLQGLASGDELRAAFDRLRAAGKRVYCHLDDAGNAALLACAGADRVAIDPIATVRTAGLRTARFFLGDALAELGVRTQFVRIGPWKSAAEQFTRASSSPEALAQENALLDAVLSHLTRTVGRGRGWTEAQTRELLFSGPFSAREAVERRLIDELATLDAFARGLAARLGATVTRMQEHVPLQSRRWAPGRTIAVLHIHGDIVDGESQDVPLLGAMVGDRTIIEAIEALSSASRVAAVVVRVDSPGGSASASERMWRALSRLARVKPVLTSIGRTAASGGYYVAAPAREIFALPASITGSIGIFFGKADIAPLLTRLHVGVETTRRGERADMDSIYRPFTEAELAVVGRLITEFYQLFLDRVAEGRHRTRAQIHAVAEGRVFTGAVARTNGLVDREGGLLTAIDRAAQIAGLGDDYEVITVPRADPGLLGLVRSALNVEDPREPFTRMLSNAELGRALRWLYAVANAPAGQPLALTEWPLLTP
jgi:protease-4